MAGRFYSESITTTGADEDVLDGMRTTLAAAGITLTTAKIVTLLSTDNIGVDINGTGVYSYLYADPDAVYSLSLKEGEVVVSKILIETSSHTVWVGIVY
jgi:hypothetical protein